MFSDPQFWVAVAFVAFIAAIFNPVRKILTSSLDAQIKDIRNKILKYLDTKFKGNENFKKIVNSSAFCSENNNIVSDNYKITSNEKIAIIPPIGGG